MQTEAICPLWFYFIYFLQRIQQERHESNYKERTPTIVSSGEQVIWQIVVYGFGRASSLHYNGRTQTDGILEQATDENIRS
jgi:hypothetical protein